MIELEEKARTILSHTFSDNGCHEQFKIKICISWCKRGKTLVSIRICM